MSLRVRHTDTIRISWWKRSWMELSLVTMVMIFLLFLLFAAHEGPVGTLAFSGTVIPSRSRSKQHLLVQSTRCWSTSTPGRLDPMGDDIPPVSLLSPSSSPIPITSSSSSSLLPSLRPSRRTVLRPLWSSISTNNVVTSTTESKQPSPSLGLTFRSAANWASLLCVVDCTLLPLVSLLLPLLGWVNLGSSSSSVAASAMQVNLSAWMHGLALYFVLPVGTTTVAWNYWTGHRNVFVAGLGVLGLTLVGLANVDLVHPILHHGTTTTLIHRIINVLGCLFLLGSNVLSQQLGCDCGIPFCKPINGNKMNLQRRGGGAPKNHPLLVVPPSPSLSSTSTTTSSSTTTTTAMSFQTKMIQHKQQQQQQQLQQVAISGNESNSAGGPTS